ncbi:RagB/SusD family nutrient uptake outer membrane protein [Fibrella forsythiae]|uniref:RagB/SusD family nutrient uptake outer membrane protein n=1 Tax=Fibrella forsythiae TaxID=2817061 RepID=A0ABS3JGD1_9BACT|nr:RagB/SusD family nutrient uptake outer membrane protein [Fibrella forsythiae]MBO0949040.1 RagB/SusD family nutrient uptake outer membrane protein [Fibrella forsythiae]
MKTYIKNTLLTLTVTGLLMACSTDELDVKNPNQPTPSSAATEVGVISLAQGTVYINGMGNSSAGIKYYDGVPGGFWTGAVGFHALMGDEVGEEAANQFGNQIGMPDLVTLDDGTKVTNPSSVNTQIALIRTVNVNAQGGANPLFNEWAYMYNLNNGMNSVLEIAASTKFAGDAAAQTAKLNTLKAWAYWWKGYAYSRIGSIYYAGLINDKPGVTTGNYVTKEKIIEEAAKNFDLASTALTALGAGGTDYTAVMRGLIPSFNQVGKGVVPTPDEWKRNINTMKARNIVVNTPAKSMTAAQWGQVLTLTNDGVRAADKVFTGRSNSNSDFMSRLDGNIAAKSTGPTGGTFKISERLIQDFPAGDKRLDNNFTKQPAAILFNQDRGNSFNTRWLIDDGGKGMAGVVVLNNRVEGAYELYLASTFEENELMKAEAKIYTSDIAGGLTAIDVVRTSQGAGLAPLSGLTQAQALEELRKERRVALAFRGLAFYDARRWGVITDGRKGAVVVDKAGKVSTNATINYNFLDYWDVPDNELAYNPAAAGSAATKNPK